MNLWKVSGVVSLAKYLLIAWARSFLMTWVTFLRISFEMLSGSEALPFSSLWIACSTCSEVIVNEILSMWFAGISPLMLLRSAWLSSEKNFFISICALRMLSLLVLLQSVLHKSEIWNDACDLSMQSLLHCKSLYNSFSYVYYNSYVFRHLLYLKITKSVSQWLYRTL